MLKRTGRPSLRSLFDMYASPDDALDADAATDWEAELQEFADMLDRPDALCVMKEIPEASRSQQKPAEASRGYQKVWFCKGKKATANLLRSLQQCMLPTCWTVWTSRRAA
jgi:hypothetical protein